MDSNDFEGSLVLEKLASLDLVDDFFEAVDSDNFKEVVSLLRQADVDEETITMVLNKMSFHTN